MVAMLLNFGLEFVYNLVQLVGCDFNKEYFRHTFFRQQLKYLGTIKRTCFIAKFIDFFVVYL